MALAPGTRLGPFEIVSALGAGGMGEVYRARDTKLNRDVAIKVLLPAVANDPDRLARFSREAQVLASLNHPNIAHIHGLEDSGGVPALVMELVDGPTLADRIAQGAIPFDEALPIAKQIAEALEAAHEQGITHRDLKPANIKVRPDGTVKVLDFGLAKAMQPSVSSPNVSQSPTITTPAMTQAGMILGTAAYMSPEQARGKAVDKRTDIWAFGCVLYEMLTGQRAFAGDDVSDVLASVLAREPDWARLPATVSPALGTYIRRCLNRNPKQRIGDVQDVRLALEGAFDADVAPPPAAPVRLTERLRVAALTGVLLVVAGLTGATVWFTMRPPEPVLPRVSRLQVSSSGNAALTISDAQRHMAITPDGARVIYVGNQGTQLFVRALDALDPVAVFTRFPQGPFVSPDGQWIGFTDSGMLKKVPLNGGPAVPITTIDAPTSLGATWGPDDTIIFATTNGGTGLQQVSAAGGPTTVLTRADGEQGEADHAWPEWLPGGRAVLFTTIAVTGRLDDARVAVLDLRTGTRRVLVAGSHAHYVPSERGSAKRTGHQEGHLVYATAGTLRAVAFDLARLETRGTPVAVVHDVVTTAGGAVDAVVAADGTLAYVSGTGATERARTLVWVDRQGRETPIPAPPRRYVQPRLSPDGTHVAVFVADQELDLWLSDLGQTLTRITSGPGVDFFPVWTPDSRLIFSSQRSGRGNLFWQTAGAARAVERLTDSPNLQTATDISPGGRILIFTETAPKTGEDIMQMTLDGTRQITPLVRSSFAERNGIVSPDGRWLAYESNENSNRFEIFVRPFPEVNNGHWQVSTTGGNRPLWARNGQELIYVSPTGALMRVGVLRGPSWTATAPTLLVKEGYFTSPGNPGRTYDISPDGRRLLMVKEGVADTTAAPASLVVVQHWVEELEHLVPTK